jgi:hypothetical protein
MQEIRLTWRPDVVHHTDVVRFSDEWVEATRETVTTMQIVVKAANEIYGIGSHWLETRPSEPSKT